MTIENIANRPTLPDPPTSGSTTTDPASEQGLLRVGTYNLAGANDSYNGTENIEATTRTLAEQVVGGVDVVALQEVDVGTTDTISNLRNGGIRCDPEGLDDYNEYVLAQISAEEQGLQGQVTYTRRSETDDQGKPVTVITGLDAQGRTSEVRITEEHYAADGTRIDRPVEPRPAPMLPSADPSLATDSAITVYNADVRSPDGWRDYTVVYGASGDRDIGTFGNAVLLGPRASLQRDLHGDAQLELHDLGANDPTYDENRTALQAQIDVAGERTTVFSTHLTYDKYEKEEARAARDAQHEELGRLAAMTGGNTLVLGDFNDESQDELESRGEIGALTGQLYDENFIDDATAEAAANHRPNDTNIDRIYVSGDVFASHREEIFAGGSDHEMVTWDVDLGN